MPPEHYLRDFADIRELLELSFDLEREVAPTEDVALLGSPVRPIHVDGYEVQCELARGGMGVIWLVRDLELRRYLAIKVLKKKHLHDPVRGAALRGRGPDHRPTPAPGHSLGISARYFVGERAALFRHEARAGADAPRPAGPKAGLGSDRAGLLTIFEQVCQTLAYAHSRRDSPRPQAR